MDIETQEQFLNIINDDIDVLKQMLDRIQVHITQYPVYTQLEFLKPLKMMITEAYLDAQNPNDKFLNTFDGGDDKIEI